MNLYKFAELYDQNGDLSKRWFVGYSFKHPETNKYKLIKIYISSKLLTKHARRVKANQLIENIDNRLRQGYNPYQNENIGYTSVINAVNKVIEYKKTYTRKRTISTYMSFVNAFFEWLILENMSNLAIECFNFQHVIKFADYLKIVRKVSNRTHNNYLEGLRTIFNELVKREYLLKNPFKNFTFLPLEERNIFAYTDVEVSLLKNYCLQYDEKMWLVCQFIFYCAIRPAELVLLKIKYFDIAGGKICIPSHISKNKKQSIINIPEAFIEDLIKLNLTEINQEYFLFSKHLIPGDFYIAPTRLAERFRKIADEIGLSRRLYDLKHTGAGLAVKNGANIKDMMYHLRHSSIEITDLYLRAFSSETSREFIKNFPRL